MTVSAVQAAQSSAEVVIRRRQVDLAKMGGTDTPAEAQRTAIAVGVAKQALYAAQAQEISLDDVPPPPSHALEITATPEEIARGRFADALVQRQGLGI